MPELVTIPIAIFEIKIEYASPNMKLVGDRTAVVDQLFRKFGLWDVTVDDVEVIKEGKMSSQGIKFKLPRKRTSFFFGPSDCKLIREDADWESAGETITILSAGWNTLVELGEVQAGAYKTSIAMHLQPKTLPFIELLKPFSPGPLATLDPSPIRAIAAIIKWEERRVTIDGSANLANGLFLRLERDFDGAATFDQIADQLKADETQVLDLIGVKEDRS